MPISPSLKGGTSVDSSDLLAMKKRSIMISIQNSKPIKGGQTHITNKQMTGYDSGFFSKGLDSYLVNTSGPDLPIPVVNATILVYNANQGDSFTWGGNTFTRNTNLPNFSYTATTSYFPENTTDDLTPVSQLPSYPNLIGVTIGNSVTSIGNKLFSRCTALTSITIPNSVTSIGVDTFYLCTALTSITIPNSFISIGTRAFNSCTALTSITIPNSVTSIGNAFYYCTALTSITIPNSVTSIGNEAFYGCSGLTSITIPNSVTSIGNDAFKGCTALTSITIGISVTSIGNEVFYNCSSLTSITIPNSVTSIGDNAFLSSGLTNVTIANGQLGITSPTANPPGVSFFGVNVATTIP